MTEMCYPCPRTPVTHVHSLYTLLVNQLWDWAPGRTGICCVRLEARRSPADTFLAISPVPTHFLFGLGPTYLLG